MTIYRIKAVRIQERELITLKAAKTSADFSLFFPPEEFSRNEVVNMIRQGDIFLKSYRDGRKVKIHLKTTLNLGIEQFDDLPRY